MITSLFYLRPYARMQPNDYLSLKLKTSCPGFSGGASDPPADAAPPEIEPCSDVSGRHPDLAWVLIPIWFIASMALTTPAEVRAYPKGILPFIPLSTETMEFFLRSRGILPGLRNSIVVALITLVLSILIAAPAGYALSRFLFRGRDMFRLSILAVRAFPIVVLSIPLAVVFLRTGIYDNVIAWVNAYRPGSANDNPGS
jgi:ABC-type spermidine/putrescine transport system permease subunit I